MKLFFGVTILIFCQSLYGSNCTSVVEKIANLHEMNLSSALSGRMLKHILMEEEKKIPKPLLTKTIDRASTLSGGDDKDFQKLALEPFLFALVICKEKPQISFQKAFEEAVDELDYSK